MAGSIDSSLATRWSFPTYHEHRDPERSSPAEPRTRTYAADRWSALGSYAQLVVADADRLPAARAACDRILARIDATCSRFRDDSDLVRANHRAGTWVQVDPLLIDALTAAVKVAEDTAGLVDPALGRHLVALGYDRDLAEIRLADAERAETEQTQAEQTQAGPVQAGPGAEALPPVDLDGWRRIEIDPAGAIRVPTGLALDLGATGKAFAADLIAQSVPAQVGTALIISLGGDVSIGASPSDPSGTENPWQVAIAERPEQAGETEIAETVVLETGGLATSSVLARRWQRGGGIAHHLLDPRTGLPVDPVWRTVSVCAANCLQANAATTAAIVMGAQAPGWLERADLAARLVAIDGSVLRIAGWPEQRR